MYVFEKPLATTIPSAEGLKLTSSAISDPSGPALPPTLATESVLKRDDWMLHPGNSAATPTRMETSTSGSRAQLPTGDESFTDDYGESTDGARNLSGGVDFFSSLGTDIKKKNVRPDRSDPDKVRHINTPYDISFNTVDFYCIIPI